MYSNDQLNLINYYENGYIHTYVDPKIRNILWNEIDSTNWIDDTKEGIYSAIPDWYQSEEDYALELDGSNRAEFERKIGKELREKTPISLIQTGYGLLETEPFRFFKTFYQNSDLKYIDMWNGSEEIDFHFDTINGCDTLVLIYLNDYTGIWRNEWGGTITMKKQVGVDVKHEKTFFPIDGTMLIINNANPLILHKVTELKKKDMNRYTFSFIYKWS